MRVKEIQAINGLYPPTFEGILRAIGELGETSSNGKIVAIYEDGDQEIIPFALGDTLTEDCKAAEIAHNLGIEHDKSLCILCDIKEAEKDEEFRWFSDSLDQ